jgi:hypothetical protein
MNKTQYGARKYTVLNSQLTTCLDLTGPEFACDLLTRAL